MEIESAAARPPVVRESPQAPACGPSTPTRAGGPENGRSANPDRRPRRAFKEILHDLLGVERSIRALLAAEDEKLAAGPWLLVAQRQAGLDDDALAQLDRRVRDANSKALNRFIGRVIERCCLSDAYKIPPPSLRQDSVFVECLPTREMTRLGLNHAAIVAVASLRAVRKAPGRFGPRISATRDIRAEAELRVRRTALREELERAHDLGTFLKIETSHVGMCEREAGLVRARFLDFARVLLSPGWPEALCVEALARGLPPKLIWNPASAPPKPREPRLPRLAACVGCGGPLTSPEAFRWCSRECAENHYSEERRRKSAEGRVGMTCENCGQPLTAKRTDARFCTRACMNEARDRAAPLRTCAWCGIEVRNRRTNGKADPVFCCRSHAQLFRYRAQAAEAGEMGGDPASPSPRPDAPA